MPRLTKYLVTKLTLFIVKSFEAGRGIPESTGAQPTSAEPSGARTQGGLVAAPSIPGRGSADARSLVTLSASARERRRCARLIRPRTKRRAAFAAVGCVLVAMGLPLPASASTAIETFSNLPSTPQAGGHPNLLTTFTLSSHQVDPVPCACDDAKDVTARLPAGFIGNPHATPQCDVAQFASGECPVDSQVGVVYFSVSAVAGLGRFENQLFLAPLYNLIPPPSQPALLGFMSPGYFTPTFEDVSPRTNSDYGLDVTAYSIEHIAPITGFQQLTWGVPASPANDNFRFGFAQSGLYLAFFPTAHVAAFCDASGELTEDPASIYEVCPNNGALTHPAPPAVGEWPFGEGVERGPGHPVASSSPEQPFLQGPTTCGLGSLSTSLEVLSYDRGVTEADSPWPPTTGCGRLTFNPSQSIEPTTHAADSPSGAEFRLTVPQFESPSVPSPSELRAAHVTLPPGYSLAPNVTNGKDTCSEAQAETGPYASTEEGHCPEDSKIGTLSVDTPVLPGPLNGAAYLGEPKPGNRFRMFLLFDGFGVHVKLPGTITPDPATGQIHIDFENLPQAPFETFNLHIFGSERGPLDTPTQCGTYEVKSEFVPWDSALSSETSRQSFEVTEGPNGAPCPSGPRPFHPAFQAASSANTAAAHTSFQLDLTREDGEQNISSLKVTTPPGFAATLKGVSYCPQASIEAAEAESHTGLQEQADPSCPASSYVGELTAAAGPGTHPLYLSGRVYLAGPYQGAPLSFVFITPAVSGGYDLGNVVLREGLDINPETAQVSTAGAKLPLIFQGIPLRLRQIFIDLNRPGFALNPTNCSPLEVKAEVFGTEGALSTASNHFQVANCASLAFKPKLSMSFSGSTKQAGNPAVHADISYPSGGSYANIAHAAVTLPPTDLIDNAHINTPCTKVQFVAGTVPGEKCPPGSVIGFAKAITPLLEKPVEGPVYLRTHPGVGLPNLVAALNGQIDVALVGSVDTVNGRIRTTFETVPDVPVSNFSLNLDGGAKGLLENKPNFCAHPLHVTADITGQNGKTADQSPLLSTPCANNHHKRKHTRHSRARHANRGGRR